MTTTPLSHASVQTAVTINAEPETVWQFLSQPDKFMSWMTFIPGSPTPPGSIFEPRPGGSLRIIFPNGGAAVGSVIELDPPRKLVFTWGYDPDVAKTGLGPGACRVEMLLAPVPGGTRVTLTHTGPLTEKLAADHKPGWRHYLSQLAVRASEGHHAAHLEATLRDYFAACNEADDAKRLALLERCAEPEIRVRGPFACSDSVQEFSDHIANGLRHMKGAVSAIAGATPHVHGFVRVPWTVAGPDGNVWFKGENFVRMSSRGRVAEIVTFHG